MRYNTHIVKKPWGYEYLVYENDKVGLWLLYIASGHQTSMHCHPNKTTGLILLDGKAELSFFGNTFKLKPASKTMIRQGLFHSTKATSKNGAFIFEIETPADKHDLVRLEDKYGRKGKPYEDSTFEIPRKEECLWIENPRSEQSKDYIFLNCHIKIENTTDIKLFDKINDDENIVFLDGGIVTDEGQLVAHAGDIVTIDTIRKLIDLFPKMVENTVFMTIRKNDE